MADKTRLLFVYGTLQSGGRLNDFLVRVGGKLCGSARILSKDFVMRDLGHYPALQKVEPGSGKYILGELWLVPIESIAEIDKVEAYPKFYNRTEVTVWSDETSFEAITYYIQSSGSLKAYMSQSPVVESGHWDATQNKPVLGHLEDKGEPIEDINEDTNEGEFVCDRGIYITSEWGEVFGPYDTIEGACRDIPQVAHELGADMRVVTVGFRVHRKDLDVDDLVDIDAQITKL